MSYIIQECSQRCLCSMVFAENKRSFSQMLIQTAHNGHISYCAGSDGNLETVKPFNTVTNVHKNVVVLTGGLIITRGQIKEVLS